MRQDLYGHGERHGWTAQALYCHIHRLFDTHVSTKEALEDVIGELTFFPKSRNKNPFKSMSPEKALLRNTTAIRWKREQWPVMEVTEDDVLNRTFSSFPRSRNKVFVGKAAKGLQFEMNRKVKEKVEQKIPGWSR